MSPAVVGWAHPATTAVPVSSNRSFTGHGIWPDHAGRGLERGNRMDEAETIIATTPERVWALITDITRMGEWSPECRGGRWTGGATGPAAGARFVGFNAHGPVRWRTHCRVVECAEPHRFAFTVAENGMTWGWRIEPDAGGTRLVQWAGADGAPLARGESARHVRGCSGGSASP